MVLGCSWVECDSACIEAAPHDSSRFFTIPSRFCFSLAVFVFHDHDSTIPRSRFHDHDFTIPRSRFHESSRSFCKSCSVFEILKRNFANLARYPSNLLSEKSPAKKESIISGDKKSINICSHISGQSPHCSHIGVKSTILHVCNTCMRNVPILYLYVRNAYISHRFMSRFCSTCFRLILHPAPNLRPEGPERVNWVVSNPGQISLNSSQVHWTNEVLGFSFSRGKTNGIAEI